MKKEKKNKYQNFLFFLYNNRIRRQDFYILEEDKKYYNIYYCFTNEEYIKKYNKISPWSYANYILKFLTYLYFPHQNNLILFSYSISNKNFKKLLINKEQFNINLQRFNLINNIEIIEEEQPRKKNKI